MPVLWEHGTSQFANEDDLSQGGYLEGNGLTFGCFWIDEEPHAVTYGGDSHMITVAPTRSGKGTTQIIPNLMNHQGSSLCIDPKGENAIITAEWREKTGDTVHILDPWGQATNVLERDAAQFNPLDTLDPDDDDFVDDALLIADALVVETGGDSHWTNEARAMVMGFILYIATDPNEAETRHLGRLRDILNLDPKVLQELVSTRMATSPNVLVRSAANRFKQKTERELASVISTAQQNTHFLESPKLKTSLEKSSFDFADLKNDDAPISVYIVLPADRLNTHGRWLRLIVSMAITAMVRGGNKPKRPALFTLDEFAALGKLAIVEQAFGLMAGFGMQIHAILQDLSQLQDLYKQRWQTFIGNAGVLQIFGTRDVLTAEYISKIAGMMTIEKISEATGQKRKGTEGIFGEAPDPEFRSMNDSLSGRALLMPEEVMRLGQNEQVIFLPSCQPILCGKVPYHLNARFFETDGTPRFRIHPNAPEPTKMREWDQRTKERFIDQINTEDDSPA